MQPASGIDLRTNPVSEGKGEGFVDHVRELEKGGPSGVVGPAPRGELASSPEQKSWKTVRNWLTGVEPTDPVDTISEKPSEEEIAENEPPGKKVPVKLKPRQSVLANSIRGVERAARMAYSQTHQQRNAQTEQQQEEGENGESQTVLQRIATAKSQQAYPTPDTSTLLGMLVVQRKETGKKAVVDDAEERRVEVSNIPSSAKFKESKGMGGDGRQLKVPESNVTTERVSGHW
ncbi:hypothetical protein BJ742DRAFT_785216 [Cladochytrium replicatum]|nr:hypothetical protein BJ742DRAFT_785216 [Cladochytrium replicatum]